MDRLNQGAHVDAEMLELRESNRPAPTNLPKFRWVVPGFLLLLYLTQCAWFIGTQSLTIDEPMNIRAGLEQWRMGRFSGGEAWNDHPPLARLLCTLPAINEKFQVIDPDRRDPTPYPTGDRKTVLPSPAAVAWHTRPVNVILGTTLGLLVWIAARRMYSEGTANLSLVLFALSPSLIAHFSLVGTDGIVTLMTFSTVLQLVRWRHNQSYSQTAVLGVVLGGLLISKFSALPLAPLALALVLVLQPDGICLRPTGWNWKRAALISIIAFVVVWASYGFHMTAITPSADGHRVTITIPNRPQPIVKQISRPWRWSLRLPAYEYVQALWFQVQHNRTGHPSFLFGRIFTNGSKLYMPMAILLKWPAIVLFFGIVVAAMMVRRRLPLPRDLAVWAIFPAVFLFFALFTRIDIGERLILPAYPFLLLFSAGIWELARKRRALLVVVIAVLGVQTLSVLRYVPDYLSYFNLFVTPTNSYKLLSDSNVDWGEGLIALRKYQQAYPNEIIHLAYSGTIDPVVYGVHALPLMPNQRVSGTVIISANYLSGQTLEDPNSYHWVLHYPRKAILNHSLHVFEVPTQNTP